MDSTALEPRMVQLRMGLRKIRNIEFDEQDFRAIGTTGIKITGTALNTFGAVLQQQAELNDGSPDWCVFSSWLGDLVQEKAPAAVGTVEQHVRAACPSDTLETLLARRQWIIPLNGGSPKHWVLGWIDDASGVIGIADSIPELGSSYWAEPLLLKVIDAIRLVIRAPPVIWNEGGWNRTLVSPPALQCQMDGWSCGLFVIMAIIALTDGSTNWDSVADRNKDAVRIVVLDTVLTVPISRAVKTVEGASDSDGDEIVEVVDHRHEAGPTMPVTTVRSSVKNEKSVIQDSGEVNLDPEPVIQTKAEFPPHLSDGEVPKKELPTPSLKRLRTSEEPESDKDDDKHKYSSKKSKQPRKPYKNTAQRQQALVNDQWSSTVEEHRILCRGCNEWITLRNDRPFEAKNWELHKKRCSQITGRKTKRICLDKKKSAVAPAGVPSLATFFQIHRSAVVSTPKPHDKDEPVAKSQLTGKYIMRQVTVPKSVSLIFAAGPNDASKNLSGGAELKPPVLRPCRHLTGPDFQEYILRSHTRSFGGISFEFRGRLARQLFPWKSFSSLQSGNGPDTNLTTSVSTKQEIPTYGNSYVKMADWTDTEKEKLDSALRAWARWEIDFSSGYIKSSSCGGTTGNADEICDACNAVLRDESFKAALRRKGKEAELSTEEQRKVLERRNKYAPKSLHSLDALSLQKKLSDPLIFEVYQLLERGKDTESFFKLYHLARDGKLKNLEVFTDLCRVLTDKLERENSSNTNAKYGIRYPQNYLNFMTLVRSYGPNSAKQYGIIAAQFPAPSARHLRTLVSNSTDALQNPYLIYENMARVKRFVDTVKYSGPVSISGDNTKVRSRLSYSNDFGGHILGSTLALDAVEVDNSDDIDEIIDKVKKKNALATQVRAILVKIPLPQYPPQVIALLPSNGKDNAEEIHTQHMKALAMAANLDLCVVSFAADGAAAELGAQSLMDKEASQLPPLTYDYALYGFHLKIPVFRHTGPVVCITDPPHARKTSRNQPQHGTHTASLGRGHLVNNSLILLFECEGSGLVQRDVQDVDKQDDGAARRLFHQTALWATTELKEGTSERQIKEGFHGLFVYLFIFGTLFDAWLNRTMPVRDRILCALRCRFFLHMWRQHILKLSKRYPDLYSTTRSFISPASFHIFNRLCDSLIALALVYARYYPTQPFCPWLMGTEFLEHFFGLARMLLPNFTYAEFLKMVKHMMVRQRLLLSGKFPEKRERNSAAGYIMDYDATPLTNEDLEIATVGMITDHDLNELVSLGFKEAYHICKDILCIPASLPTVDSPVDLIPLGVHTRKAKAKPTRGDVIADAQELGEDSEIDFNDTDLSDDSESDDDENSEKLERANKDNQQYGKTLNISAAVAAAAEDTARLSALCNEYDDLNDSDVPDSNSLPIPSTVNTLTSVDDSACLVISAVTQSKFINGSGKISILAMLKYRDRLQSGTTVHSERVVRLSSKFSGNTSTATATSDNNSDNDQGKKKMSSQEASHRLRIAQAQDTVLTKQPKKTRELRWQEAIKSLRLVTAPGKLPNMSTRNVNAIFPLKLGNFVILRTNKRTYIGEILDMYKKGASARYGSVKKSDSASELQALSVRVYLPLIMGTDDADSEDEDELPAPLFSCKVTQGKYYLHTYAPIKTLLYHLGRRAFKSQEPGSNQSLGSPQQLTQEAAAHWVELNKKAVINMLPKLTIRIRGGRS